MGVSNHRPERSPSFHGNILCRYLYCKINILPGRQLERASENSQGEIRSLYCFAGTKSGFQESSSRVHWSSSSHVALDYGTCNTPWPSEHASSVPHHSSSR